MTNFGVQPFLEEFLKLAPEPGLKSTPTMEVDPKSKEFSAFVFKIQANMNPAHRDRIAFIRICSGRFSRGMSVYHARSKKEIRLSQPQQFMAHERNIIEEAYAGDIIGIFDPGIFRIGDTLSENNKELQFESIPIFPAEKFARVTPADTMKRKQFVKGINQLSEEGAIQVFKQIDIGIESFIIGVVGVLQLDVLEYRLQNEYGVELRIQSLPFRHVRWLENRTMDPRRLTLTSSTMAVHDENGRYALLFENEWSIRWSIEKNDSLELISIANNDVPIEPQS